MKPRFVQTTFFEAMKNKNLKEQQNIPADLFTFEEAQMLKRVFQRLFSPEDEQLFRRMISKWLACWWSAPKQQAKIEVPQLDLVRPKENDNGPPIAAKEDKLFAPTPQLDLLEEEELDAPHTIAQGKAQKLGLKNSAAAFAASKILNPPPPKLTPDERFEQEIKPHIEDWLKIGRIGRERYQAQPEEQRIVQPSAIDAFLFNHKDELPLAENFLLKRLGAVASILKVADPKKRRKVSARRAYRYLELAFVAYVQDKPLPQEVE